MDPLSIAMMFSSIVGLVGLFKSERRANATATKDEFFDWLRTHQHDQLAALILDNAELARSLEGLLAGQHEEVLAKLNNLDRVLTEVASHIEGFKPLADAMQVESQLSEQAIGILRQLNEAGSSQFLELDSVLGNDYVMGGGGDMLDVPDPRFIESDLNTLIGFGLLLPGTTSQGTRLFTITRAGAAVGG